MRVLTFLQVLRKQHYRFFKQQSFTFSHQAATYQLIILSHSNVQYVLMPVPTINTLQSSHETN